MHSSTSDAHTYPALDHDLEIIPVINKIDLPGAREGKRRMKRLGKVEIPQEAFLAILQVD